MMKIKRKQLVSITAAAVITVTSVWYPAIDIYAQETNTAVIEENMETEKKETALPPVLPQELKGESGQILADVMLPEGWNWVDESTVMTEEITEYPARLAVDDVIFDYTGIEGYDAEGHYVEKMIPVAVASVIITPENTEEPDDKSGEREAVTDTTPEKNVALNMTAAVPNSSAVITNNNDITIDDTNFPDKAFQNWIRKNITGADDDILSESEREAVTNINIAEKTDIEDITGIEFFPKLRNLYCRSSGVKSLDVSKNGELRTLSCDTTTIDKLDVTQNPLLRNLYCHYTGISDLDLSGNPSLYELQCANTDITSLNLTNNKSLQKLNCRGNKKLKQLNLDSNKSLRELSCEGTGITDLKIENNTNLTYLDCYGTDIKSLNLTKNTNLQKLNCSGNQINDLNLSNNKKLTSLNCYSTLIDKIDLSANTELEKLYCGKTGIKNLDLSSNTKLKLLNCGEMSIETLNLSQNSALTEINADKTQFKSFDIKNNVNLKRLSIQYTNLTEVDLSKNTNLEYLPCTGSPIEKIDLSQNKKLTFFMCWLTSLKALDVSNNSALTTLYCSGLDLAYLHIGGNPNLNVDRLKNSVFTLQLSKRSFDITKEFPGIDVGRIRSMSGATRENNMVSGYQDGTPIVYEYDCGTSKSGPVILRVTLNLDMQKQDSSITINANLDKTYDGKQVNLSENDVNVTGSTGKISYTWQKYDGDNWADIADAPADAGKYKVTAHVAGDVVFNPSASSPMEFEIHRAESKIAINGNLDKTYDGQPISLSGKDLNVTGSQGSVSYEWKKKIGTTWEPLPAAPSEAGTYQVTAHVAEDKNYNSAASAAKEFVINKGATKVEVMKDLNKNYDGQPVLLSDKDLKITGSQGTVSYAWEKKSDAAWEKQSSAPSEAGTYRVTVQVEADGNCNAGKSDAKEFTISKNVTTVEIKKDLDKSYDGQPVSLSDKDLKITGSQGTVSYAWEKKSDAAWEKLSSAPSEAGTYRVTAQVEADGNYNAGKSDAKEFTISKNVTTVEIKKDLNKSYDGQPVSLSDKDLKITGSQGSVSYVWEKKSDAAWEKQSSAPSEAGTYRVTVQVEADGNYNAGKSDAKEFTISKNVTTIEIRKELNKSYDGQSVSLSDKDLKITGSQGTVSYVWEKKSDATWEKLASAPSEAGTYRVTAQVEADANYNAGKSDTKEFTISKNVTTVEIKKDLDKSYDGQPVSLSDKDLKITGSQGTVSYAWEKKSDAAWEKLASAPSGAGTYRVTAQVEADVNYNAGKSDAKEFTISKNVTTVEIKKDLNKSYDGQPVSLSDKDLKITGSQGTVSYEWEKKSGTTWEKLSSAPSEVGTYRVVAEVEADGNYNAGKSDAKEFTISKNVTTVEIKKDLNKSYDGQPSSLSDKDLKITGSQGTVSYVWEKKSDAAWEKLASAPSEVGIYRVTAEVEADGNHNAGKSDAKEFTISKNVTTIEIKKDLDKSYDGQPVSLSDKDLKITGSQGTVSYAWEKKSDAAWEKMSSAPSEAGIYRVTAEVEADENYNAGKSDAKEFIIKKAATLVKINKDLDKDYDGKPVSLTVKDLTITGSQGEVSYEWEKKNGSVWEALSSAPGEVGTYRVTVHVEGDKNYETGHSSALNFSIKKVSQSSSKNTSIKNTNGKASKKNTAGTVQTGDVSNAGMWTFLTMLSGIVVILAKRKVKDK